MRKKQIVFAYIGLILYAAFPLLGAILASTIAQATGSRLNEGMEHPCIVLGVDIGGLLYALFLMHWLGVATVPSGALGLIVLSITLLMTKSPGSTERKDQRLESLAVASVVLSAMGLIIGPLGAIPGIVCGYVSEKRIAKNPELRGKGVASTGIIVGFLTLALYVVLFALTYK